MSRHKEPKHTYFSWLLDVESVGDESQVRVNETEGLWNVFLHIGAGVEDELHPSKEIVSNIVSECLDNH